MYICICKGITEEKIRKAMNETSKTHDVLKKLGVGDDCGVCLISAIERLQKLKKNNSPFVATIK